MFIQELYTILSYENNNTLGPKKRRNRAVELKNISILMISVSIVSRGFINLDAIKVYASDRLGMTEKIMVLENGELDTSIITHDSNNLSNQEFKNIIGENKSPQLSIHPAVPIEDILKQKMNNYNMPFNTLPPVNKIMISGINVDAPIISNYSKTPEQIIKGDFSEELLEGVAKYPATPNPGEKGHTLIFGHSSSEFRNHSKYNAVFAKLPQMTTGSMFSIVWNGQLYKYKIVDKDIIEPKELQDTYNKRNSKEKNYLTLITCRPIGTASKRMTVTAEIIDDYYRETTPSLAYEQSKKE